MPDDPRRPVCLEATESFYKKLNRIAKQCGVSRYKALSKGLDTLFREKDTELRLESECQEPCAVGSVPQHFRFATLTSRQRRTEFGAR
jgi:hypothetical protein